MALIKTILVGIYSRVSSGIQANEGKSLAAQKAEMLEFAQARGWKVVAEFIDAGETGTNMDRPGLQAALTAMEEGAFDVLLVHDLSRLSRRLYDTLNLFERFGRMDVGFASVKEPNFDFSTPTGRLVLTVLAALNQYYVDLLKMHTAKSKRERARRGLYNASITPYGYRHVGDEDTPPEILPEEATVVESLFDRYATGLHSYREVAEWLNETGYRTRDGNRFSKDTIADMLRNPFYMGKIVYKQGQRRQGVGEIFEGQHQPIVSEELWNRCAQVRDQRSSAPRAYQSRYRVYLLNRIATCDICSRKLRAQTTHAGQYYRDVSKQRGFLDCPSAGRGVRANRVDPQVGTIVRQLKLPDDWQVRLQKLIEDEDDMEILASRRARLVAERRRLKQAWVRGDFEDEEDEDIYNRELNRIRRALADLPGPEELAAIQHAADLIEELWEVWDVAEKEDRRDLLRLALRDVKIDVLQSRVVSIEPYPVFVPLFRELEWMREVGFGVFHPIWSIEQVEQQDVLDVLPPLTELPIPDHVPDWPLVVDLPTDLVGNRITPMVSDWLKERRYAEKPLGPIVEFRDRDVFPLRVDPHHWGDAQIAPPVEALDRLPDESVGFLWSPFTLQRRESKISLLDEVWRVLEPGGMWGLVDLIPASMVPHWLYRYFPEALKNDQGSTWNTYELYNKLREVGFDVELKRSNLSQAVALGVAQKLTAERERCPQLATMPDVVYEAGMSRLQAAVEEQGAEHLEPSEVCLVEVRATKT